ncbi:ABC transporter permease [Microbacterium sp. 1P10UB]|uniref:ABC transporter permease n=1 Tax=unclassified Microbacterium TaxID=2609290 RepID=UPI0039A1CF4D
MRVVTAVVGRNLRLFFRDPMNVFFSLLGALILFLLYTLFLGNLQIEGLKGTFPDATEDEIRTFVDSWMFAGIVLLSTITTGLGALAPLVNDRETGRFRDFLVSPVRRSQLVLGYLISAVTVAILMSSIVLVIGLLYLGLVDGVWPPVSAIVRLLGAVVLCCLGFTALTAFIVTFVKTSAAFSGLSTVMGTILGFVAGAYIPVGSLPDGVANGVNTLPFAQGAMLLRQEFTRETLATMVGTVDGAAASISEFYGIDILIDGNVLPVWVAVAVLCGVAVVFTVLSSIRIRGLIR